MHLLELGSTRMNDGVEAPSILRESAVILFVNSVAGGGEGLGHRELWIENGQHADLASRGRRVSID
jgi:hypothetical protein